MEMNQNRCAISIEPLGFMMYNLKLVRLQMCTHAVQPKHVRLYIYIYIYSIF